MNEWIALLYGIIQGVTEFAPVSSSGHLALLPHLINFKDPGVIFDLGMHMGTLFAVLIYFRKEVWSLIQSALLLLRGRVDNYFLINMLIATGMTVMMILLIKGFALQFGRSPLLVVINLIVFAFLMYFADRFFVQDKKMNMDRRIYFKESLLIGVAQSLAIFPGVSRSGVTLTLARVMKLTRLEASRFSFLLSAPIILAGFIHELPQLIGGEIAFDLGSCLLGAVISFVVGITTIHFFMRFISQIGLKYFAFYRVLLALVVAWVLLL